MKRKIQRLIQRATGFHYIHEVQNSFGYKIPFTGYGFFYGFWKKGLIKTPIQKINVYHNCTKTGVY